MNNCTFIGRLTKDPEIRYTKDNKAVCSFTIAVNRYKGMADFFRVEAWGETARNCEKYLAKGRQVGVVGDMRNNSYEKDGVKHSYDVLHADRVDFLEWGEKKESPEQIRDEISNKLSINPTFQDIGADDLPF